MIALWMCVVAGAGGFAQAVGPAPRESTAPVPPPRGRDPVPRALTAVAVLLTIGSAAMDVACFTRLGSVFASVMTSNILFLLGRLEALLGSDPSAEDVSQAFWHACTGGQRRAAEYLLPRGADLNWEPDYAHGTPLDAASGLSTRQENVISWLRELEPVPPAPSERPEPGILPGRADHP